MIQQNHTVLRAIYRVTKKIEKRQEGCCPEPDVHMKNLEWDADEENEEQKWINELSGKDDCQKASFEEMKRSLFEVPDEDLPPLDEDHVKMCQQSLLNTTTSLLYDPDNISIGYAVDNSSSPKCRKNDVSFSDVHFVPTDEIEIFWESEILTPSKGERKRRLDDASPQLKQKKSRIENDSESYKQENVDLKCQDVEPDVFDLL